MSRKTKHQKQSDLDRLKKVFLGFLKLRPEYEKRKDEIKDDLAQLKPDSPRLEEFCQKWNFPIEKRFHVERLEGLPQLYAAWINHIRRKRATSYKEFIETHKLYPEVPTGRAVERLRKYISRCHEFVYGAKYDLSFKKITLV